MTLKNGIWYEKYRPQTLDDLILSDELKEVFQSYIDKKDIPHLLLSGSTGTGKTTVSQILIKNIAGDNFLTLNASKDRGIDVLRNKIEPFAASSTFGNGLKIVFLDEADATTPDFQTALRNLMETYAVTTRFILTCNKPEGILDAIRGRCTVFEFNELPAKKVVKILQRVLDEEKIIYTLEELFLLVKEYLPDMRSIFNILQKGSVSGKFVFDASLSKMSLYKEIYEAIKKGSYSSVLNLLVKQKLSYRELYDFLFKKFKEDFKTTQAAYCHIYIDEHLSTTDQVPNQLIHFAACSIKLMKAIGYKMEEIS